MRITYYTHDSFVYDLHVFVIQLLIINGMHACTGFIAIGKFRKPLKRGSGVDVTDGPSPLPPP